MVRRIGDKLVAVSFDQLQLHKDKAILMSSAAEEQLKEMPEYKKEGYRPIRVIDRSIAAALSSYSGGNTDGRLWRNLAWAKRAGAAWLITCCSVAYLPAVSTARVDREVRGRHKASGHAPVRDQVNKP